MKHGALVLLLTSCAMLSGCATIANQGNKQLKLEPNNRHSPTMLGEAVLVTHLTDDTQIYEGDQRLVIHLDVLLDSAGTQHLLPCDEARLIGARKNLQVARFGEQCDFVVPSVWLNTHTPHTLRIVQGGREGTVVVQARMHWVWVWTNFLLGPAAPVGLIVDAVTSKWSYYGGSVDVAAVVGASSSGSR